MIIYNSIFTQKKRNGMDAKSLKLLLLQIRKEKSVSREELLSFSDKTGLDLSQIDVLNVFKNPKFSTDIINSYDALLVGGSSGTSVLQPDRFPFIPHCIDLLKHCLDIDKPVFASCYGFQLAVLALGGEIIHDKKVFECGSILLSLTTAARKDPLMRHLSNPFLGISVHQDKVLTLPKGCELLAYTDMCKHAFKIVDKPFWAFQFHPEVDTNTLRERIKNYKNIYTSNEENYQNMLRQLKPTPQSNKLPYYFIQELKKLI
jgi:GMP synthase (glutamine-hydrolysing)